MIPIKAHIIILNNINCLSLWSVPLSISLTSDVCVLCNPPLLPVSFKISSARFWRSVSAPARNRRDASRTSTSTSRRRRTTSRPTRPKYASTRNVSTAKSCAPPCGVSIC